MLFRSTSCGRTNPSDAKFCGGCGLKRPTNDNSSLNEQPKPFITEDELIKEAGWDKVSRMRTFYEYVDEFGDSVKLDYHKKVHVLNIEKDSFGEKCDIEFFENGRLAYLKGIPSYYIEL